MLRIGLQSSTYVTSQPLSSKYELASYSVG
jgi:hypothetical protein